MNKNEIRLLDLIHQEALEAYWTNRNDCGTNVSVECELCHCYYACLRTKEINQLLAKLSKQV